MNGPLKRLVSLFSPGAAETSSPAPRQWVKDYDTFEVQLDGGARFELSYDAGSDDPIVRGYLEGYRPNQELIDYLPVFTKPGDCVLDLGAHIGTFSLSAAAMGRGRHRGRRVAEAYRPVEPEQVAERVRQDERGPHGRRREDAGRSGSTSPGSGG